MNSPDSTAISEREWEARRVVAAVLDPLDDAARVRVVVALAERFGLDIETLNGHQDHAQDDDGDGAAEG